MNDFEQIRHNWKEQAIQQPSEANFTQLKNRIKNVAKKQKLTNVILLITAGVLIVFFFYVGAIAYTDVALAIGAMIAVLLVRVIVELFSLKYLSNLSTTDKIQNFKARLKNYYKRRFLVHMVLTPMLLVIYCYAFWTLLPDFKASLSEGFYNYILVSSIATLFGLGALIFVQIRKELRILKSLNKD